MKRKPDKSDITVYDKRENYSNSTSSSTKTTANKGGEKHVSIPDQGHGRTELKTLTAGFSGRVYDKFTHMSIKGALIIIAKDLSIETDERGIFLVTGIKPGKYRITVSVEGYVVQSCKGTAVPGMTTKLESFHLVPSCLTDKYPNDIVKEEETVDEELVEFATEVPRSLEPPPLTSAGEVICAPEALDVKIKEAEKVSSDKNISIPTKEIQTPATAANLTETVTSAPEGIVVGGVSPVDKLPQMSAETSIVEAVQPAEVPQELSTKQTQSRSPLMPWLRRKIKREFNVNGPLKLFAEAPQEIIIQAITAINISLPCEIIFIPADKIQTSAMAINSIESIVSLPEDKYFLETVMSMPEEIVFGDVFSANELPCISLESCMAEAMQLEEAPQKLHIQEGFIKPPIELVPIAASQKKVVEEVHQEDHLEVAPEFTVREMVVKETHKERPSDDVYLSDEIVFMPAEEEIQAPAIATDSIETSVSSPEEKDTAEETVMPAPEEIITGEKSSNEELPVAPAETIITETVQFEEALQEPSTKKPRLKLKWWTLRGKKPKEPSQEEKPTELLVEKDTEQAAPFPEHQKQPIKPPIETIPQISVQKEISKEGHREEPPAEASAEEDSERNFIEEGSTAPEKTPENALDYDTSSLSDQEREAMSPDDHETVEVVGFVGSFNAQPNPAFKGLPITVAYRLRNVTCDDPDDLLVQITLVNPDTGAVLEFFDEPVKCSKGTFSIGGFTISTKTYEPHVYRMNMHILSYKTKKSHLIADSPLEIKNIF